MIWFALIYRHFIKLSHYFTACKKFNETFNTYHFDYYSSSNSRCCQIDYFWISSITVLIWYITNHIGNRPGIYFILYVSSIGSLCITIYYVFLTFKKIGGIKGSGNVLFVFLFILLLYSKFQLANKFGLVLHIWG